MSMTDTALSGSGDLDTLISALRGGVASVPPETAVSVIESWQQQLASAGSPEAQNIAQDLAALRDTLTGGSPSGASIGSLLTSLGNSTASIAGSSDAAALSPQLSELASLLQSEGATLSGNGI